MGFFGGANSNPDEDRANELLQEQIQQNQQELEQKRQDLIQQRISIVKSEGGENWTPNYKQAYQAPRSTNSTSNIFDFMEERRNAQIIDWAKSPKK
jgi:transcription elongation GreA/GreB family factor